MNTPAIDFETSFYNFIEIVSGSRKLNFDESLMIYDALVNNLKIFLNANSIDYQEFILEELNNFAYNTEKTLTLPFDAKFIDLYDSKNYKYAFLYICMQTTTPSHAIADLLAMICIDLLRKRDYGSANGFLSILADAALETKWWSEENYTLIDEITKHISDEWYTLDLDDYVDCILENEISSPHHRVIENKSSENYHIKVSAIKRGFM